MSVFDAIIVFDTPDGPRSLTEQWWREWVDGGIAVLDHYRDNHRKFAEYLDKHEEDK